MNIPKTLILQCSGRNWKTKNTTQASFSRAPQKKNKILKNHTSKLPANLALVFYPLLAHQTAPK
jgi:hypothetical protein